jgi:hypothetical protein
MESQSETLSGAPFFVNYLTSPDLLGLQLDEESFRRQILLQAQITIDFLLSPNQIKTRPIVLDIEQVKGPDRIARHIPNCHHQQTVLKELLPQFKGLLRLEGEALEITKRCMESEHRWSHWKSEGCQSIVRQPTNQSRSCQHPSR